MADGSSHPSEAETAGRLNAVDPNQDSARMVADAVLYEGYLLYPYRRSSGRNQVRWQFGVLAARDWIEARRPARESVARSVDAWRQRTECLLEARASARLSARLRFLHPQRRSVRRCGADGEYVEVDGLDLGGERHLTFDEAVPREFDVALDLAELLAESEHTELITVPGGSETEPVGDAADDRPACVVRTRCPLSARLRLSISDAAAAFPLRRLRVDVENAVSSPIIMYDHPRVAPESPGDLFDACEIDEILSLRTMTLTEEEKREARATDPRAKAIVDRVDTLPREIFARLHGVLRSPGSEAEK